jgi:tetratricopeptide (TPR) repeat protein
MSLSEDTSSSATIPIAERTARLRRPAALAALAFACLLLTVVGGAGFAGYRAGMTQRDSQIQATRTTDLKQQYDLGVGDLAAGRYTLAVERFEYILNLDPGYPGAAAKLAEAQAALQVTATPQPSPTVPASENPAEIFALAQQAYAAEDWDGVISQVTYLHSIDPDYEAVKADGLLFVALRNRGVKRIQGDEMEAGIFDLTQAEAFGPLDSEARDYRAWARLYLNAQSYWGVNWAQTVQTLELLYVLAPNFQDTSQKYYQSLLNYAAQLATAGDYCGAAEQYAIGQTLFTDQTIADAQATAQAACLLTPTATPTLDITTLPAETETPTP